MSDDTASALSVDKLTKVYLKIRQKRQELATEYKAQDEKLTKQMDLVKRELLSYCKEHNVESVKTTEGTFYRQVKRRYWTSDWESMYKFVLDNEVPEFFDKRLNQKNVGQFLEENPDLLPPGLNVDSEYTLSVRRKA